MFDVHIMFDVHVMFVAGEWGHLRVGAQERHLHRRQRHQRALLQDDVEGALLEVLARADDVLDAPPPLAARHGVRHPR